MSRRGHLTVAGIALVLGVLCLAWGRAQAPGAWLVRGYLGDVVIVIFLVAGLGAVASLALITRLSLVLAVAGGLEFFQMWHHQRGVAGVALVPQIQSSITVLAFSLPSVRLVRSTSGRFG